MKQAAKTKRKPAAKARTTSVKHKVTSKKAAPKRLHQHVAHHAKRVYHGTPKFVHGAIVGSVFGLLVVGFVGGSFSHPGLTSADILSPDCKITAIKGDTFTLNSDGTVTAKFNISGFNCHQAVTLVTWQAPDADKGQPYDEQKLFASSTGTFTSGNHTLTAKLPNCFYQIDLIEGTNPTDANGGPRYVSEGRLRRSLHGGTQSCNLPPPVVPPTTPTPTPVVASDTATTLPNTGPGAVILIFVLALLGGYVFHVTHHHRQRRKAHAHGTTHPAHRKR